MSIRRRDEDTLVAGGVDEPLYEIPSDIEAFVDSNDGFVITSLDNPAACVSARNPVDLEEWR